MRGKAALSALAPWGPRETVRAGGLVLVGVVLTMVAWWAAHLEAALDSQIRWVNLAVAGFIVASVGEITWVRRARAALRMRRRALLPDVTEAFAADRAAPADRVVAGPALALFHRAGCPLVRDRKWPARDRAAAVRDGRRACGVCRP
jgi:hypothetical protein